MHAYKLQGMIACLKKRVNQFLYWKCTIQNPPAKVSWLQRPCEYLKPKTNIIRVYSLTFYNWMLLCDLQLNVEKHSLVWQQFVMPFYHVSPFFFSKRFRRMIRYFNKLGALLVVTTYATGGLETTYSKKSFNLTSGSIWWKRLDCGMGVMCIEPSQRYRNLFPW